MYIEQRVAGSGNSIPIIFNDTFKQRSIDCINAFFSISIFTVANETETVNCKRTKKRRAKGTEENRKGDCGQRN